MLLPRCVRKHLVRDINWKLSDCLAYDNHNRSGTYDQMITYNRWNLIDKKAHSLEFYFDYHFLFAFFFFLWVFQVLRIFRRRKNHAVTVSQL